MYTLTAGISEEYTSTKNSNMQSIIDNKNSKFVEILKKNPNENTPGLGLLPHEFRAGAYFSYATGTNAPLTTRYQLFQVFVGNSAAGCTGSPSDKLSFRPAIWVK